MSRTHQFLVTLTVHTNKINPATTPTTTSTTSMTNGHPVVVIQRDAQHPHSQDLYLRETFQVNDDGSLEFVDGEPVPRGLALLISWSEVAYAEFEEL